MKMEIQDIKARLSIETLLNRYHLEVKNSHCKCPFHKDDTPSLRIYPETNTYHCFGCSKTGDVIQFIQDKENCNKHEAILKAKALATENTTVVLAPTILLKKEDIKYLELFTKFKQNLYRSKKAVAYLQNRGLSDVYLEQGFNGKHYSKLQNCIIYPLKNCKNEIVSFYGRSIIKGHYYLENRQGLYPGYPTSETKTLILTESIIDAATLLKYIPPAPEGETSILALYGTNGLTQEHTEAMKQLETLEEVILFMDGDAAGREANKTISKKLHELLPKLTITKVATPDNEDVNSLLEGHDSEILNHLIKGRKIIYSSKQENKNPAVAHRLNTKNPEYLIYQSGSLEIAVLGGVPLHNLDKLKVTLRIVKKGQNTSSLETVRQSNLDLYDDTTLTKFITKLTERLELGTKETQSIIYNFIDELENYRLTQIQINEPEKVTKRQLTEAEKQQALAFLKSDNLLEKTNELIGKTGLVGETDNRLLMYLIFTSRLREQPLHIISLGASGTGKTYLQEKIAALIPRAHKLEITALSENALYYFDRTELKNKLVLIEDLDGAQDDKILYAIRELMSKKKISKTIPIKDAKGNLKTITLHVEGPITLAGTTTKEKIYEDNANRSILIYLDNSKAQKEAIIKYQQKLSAGLINKQEEQKAMTQLQNIQCMLEPVKVRNPYAPQLQIPDTVFKPLRTNAHYLAFIETVTFYHQYQRKRISPPSGELEGDYIETTIEDIEIANRLLKDVLLTKSDELTKGCRDFFERVKKHLEKENRTAFYSQEIRKSFRMNPSNVKYYLAILNKYNLIKVIGGNPRRQGYEFEIISTEEYNTLKDSMNALNTTLEKLKISS